MKAKIIYLAILLLGFSLATRAQTTTKTEWKEQKAFHGLMSASFHPAEDGNFEPLRKNADSLLIVAKSWLASPIPADYKAEKTKSTLEKLASQCAVIKNAVDNKTSNADLFKLITEAHDIFHSIVGECRKSE